MSALAPGLYRATVRGIPGESIVMVGNMHATYSLTIDGDVRRCYVFENARPLIVLDLDKPQEFVRALRECRPLNPADTDSDDFRIYAIANQIEAQTKPARIEEPGWDGKVLAHTNQNSERHEYLRHGRRPSEDRYNWSDGLGYGSVKWDYLIDPTLIREGLS